VSTANPPPPDIADLRGLAHGLRQLFEIAASTLADDAQPSELARRVTSHLGCELTAIVPVTERFPKWEHVNVQRGVDAYLAARLTGSTVILLTGRSIRFIDMAAALARRLQPSVVVLEDVDLVATDRDYTPDGNPLLFSLLDAMDGVGADADVTFVLTTNRADILETALADRPGRVDIAIEIPRPDAACRERLFRVYVRGLAVDANLDPVVAGTEGVTASFVKEMIRRTVLASLRAGERPPVLRDAHFAAVLTEMNGERHALTRSLLGVAPGSEESPGRYRRRR
jgi:hypothetical protein